MSTKRLPALSLHVSEIRDEEGELVVINVVVVNPEATYTSWQEWPHKHKGEDPEKSAYEFVFTKFRKVQKEFYARGGDLA